MSDTTEPEGQPKRHVHRYHATCHWAGDTAMGYGGYDRAHTSSCPPAATELKLSAEPAFLGHPEMLNPEQLLLVSASSCQLLSFLAVAARARIRVLEYDDRAEAEMPEDAKPMRITKLVLRPRIVVGPGVKKERVLKFASLAHKQCYVTNSLDTEVALEPTVEIRDEGTTD
jgi:organic hydroperoxide reductase OsmC/OhrA